MAFIKACFFALDLFKHMFDLSESRSEFLEKLQRARSQVKPVTASQPVLSTVGPTKLTVGNWSLTCLKEGEIAIHNSDGQQATILKEDLPGFVFESNRGTKHSFTAETSLGKLRANMCSFCFLHLAGTVIGDVV